MASNARNDKIDTSAFSKPQYDNSTDSSENIESKDLGKVVASGYTDPHDKELQKYQSSSGKISRQALESNPSGNGDITSILRILPNVQYDNAQLKSTTPGEIDPANISISGGLFYQNNFQLDGFNMNNDLDPATNENDPATIAFLPSRSQGLNIDTSLLESITVQDSNVSAAYGGFTGGVVEANTKKARKKFGANISYQISQGNANPKAFSLTQYHILDSTLNNFLSSTDAGSQPQFIKHAIRASLESKFHDKAGIIASFTTTQSFIPLNAYDTNQSSQITDKTRKTQKRQSYNFFIKSNYDVSENLTLEGKLCLCATI